MLKASMIKVLDELIALIRQLKESEYAEPSYAQGNSTVGEHTRHIIEMFQCMINNYETGIINYNKRERNKLIETYKHYAIEHIVAIQNNLHIPDKKLQLLQQINDEEVSIKTNYIRELLYNLQHCIHHQALIKVAVMQYPISLFRKILDSPLHPYNIKKRNLKF